MEFYLLATWSLLIAFTVVNASENIALAKVTRQSSIRDSWDSSKAVDGCVLTYMTSNCCTHTAGGQTEAWWQVDLQTQSVISSVNILYRDEDSLHRLAGYEVLLSNTRDWTTGSRCHKDITAEKASMSATQYITCAGVARYMAIYNDRRVKSKTWYSDDAILELCEVQVYGCPVGKYGNCNCNNDCMNCVNNICDATSGTCGDCTAGFYKNGGNCIPCPVNCLGNKCDSLNGACADGCTTGFSGTWCRCPVNCKDTICPDGQCTECVIGFYSSLCDQPCPSYCKNNVCNKVNGQCTECNDGFYGPACTPCPNGCRTNTCDKTSGHCDLCVAGFHGSQCLKACGNCQGLSCDMETGDCATGCTEGWTGDKCDTKVVTIMNEDAAVGIGVGSGVVILALVVVIIVQTRRRTMKRGDTTSSTHMTDITLSRTANELNNDQDGNYDYEIATHKEQRIAQISNTEGNYEQLGRREVEIPHIYDTTNVDTKT